jgi:multisubunit Na+/H+ antiporter MnhF subunit
VSAEQIWQVAVLALLACEVPLLAVVLRAKPTSALVALQQASAVTTLALLALGQALGRAIFTDLALALGLLGLGTGLAVARYIERWQ